MRNRLSELKLGIDPCMWDENLSVKIVTLYSGTSGPTVGCLNEILDDVRTIYPTQSGSVEVITTESAVLDATLLRSNTPKFSSPGDSGAPVFNSYHHTMLGMLVDGHRDGYPGSWFTPVVWILDDIQKTVSEHLGMVDVLIGSGLHSSSRDHSHTFGVVRVCGDHMIAD